MQRQTSQSYSIAGYRASITVEWSAPVSAEDLGEWKTDRAEKIADNIMADIHRQMADIVDAMYPIEQRKELMAS